MSRVFLHFQRIIISLIFLLPFINWKGYWEIPKVIWTEASAIIIVGIYAYLSIRKKFSNSLTLTKIDDLYLLWLLILSASSLVGVHPVESFVGGSFRHQGVIFFLSIWLIGKSVGLMNSRYKRLLVSWMKIAVYSQLLIMAIQYFWGNLTYGRALGTFGEPNTAAGFLVLGLYFFLASKDSLSKIFILALGLLTTLSRTAFISFAIFIASTRFRAKYIFMLTICAVLLLVLFGSRGDSLGDRKMTWDLAVSAIKDRPIIGYGAESGELIFDVYSGKKTAALSSFAIDRAHNIFLDITLWSGILGLAVFVLWIGSILIKFLKEKNYLKISFMLAWLFFGFFQPLGATHWLLFFVILYI